MTTVNTDSRKSGTRAKTGKRRRPRFRAWKLYVAAGLGVSVLLTAALTVYFYRSFSRQIDARLQGETERQILASSRARSSCGAGRRLRSRS